MEKVLLKQSVIMATSDGLTITNDTDTQYTEEQKEIIIERLGLADVIIKKISRMMRHCVSCPSKNIKPGDFISGSDGGLNCGTFFGIVEIPVMKNRR